MYTDKPAAIQLALKTLGSFNLQEKLLTEFVREVVVSFLDDDDPYEIPILLCCMCLVSVLTRALT